MRVAGDIARDSVKVFALTRNTQQGDTPISRWQFQFGYPYYPPGLTRHGWNSANKVFAKAGGGGHARVHWKADIALRYYQLHGGYTPGPVFLFGLLAGIGGIFTFRRRRDSGPALACLLITGCAVAVLLGADLYEFSWRYQLPALVTLPAAGAFGVTAVPTRSCRSATSRWSSRPRMTGSTWSRSTATRSGGAPGRSRRAAGRTGRRASPGNWPGSSSRRRPGCVPARWFGSGACTSRTGSPISPGITSWPPGWSRGRRSGNPRNRTCARPGCAGPGSRRRAA